MSAPVRIGPTRAKTQSEPWALAHGVPLFVGGGSNGPQAKACGSDGVTRNNPGYSSRPTSLKYRSAPLWKGTTGPRTAISELKACIEGWIA